MLRVWMIACMTMILTGCCDWPRHEWTGVVEMEPSVAHNPAAPDISGAFAVLAIESGPDYRKPDCIDRYTDLFPRKIDAAEGGGRRPFLGSNDGLARALQADKLPVGQRVRVRGYMQVFSLMAAPEEHSKYGVRTIEREAGMQDDNTLEHVLVVEKMWLLDPPSR